ADPLTFGNPIRLTVNPSK
uniref:Uncharacterized protein n=3 Tax=Sinocyclocheilus TaxID=75365 RepID=A0A671QA87_9TELE